MNITDWKAHTAAITALVAGMRGATQDWDGSPISDGGEPRVTVTCGELRLAADEIERLRAQVAQEKEA